MKKWLKYGLIGAGIGFILSLILMILTMYCASYYSNPLGVPEGSFGGALDKSNILCDILNFATFWTVSNIVLILYIIIGFFAGAIIGKIKSKKTFQLPSTPKPIKTNLIKG